MSMVSSDLIIKNKIDGEKKGEKSEKPKCK